MTVLRCECFHRQRRQKLEADLGRPLARTWRRSAGLWRVRGLPFYVHRGGNAGVKAREWRVRDAGGDEHSFEACSVLLRAGLRGQAFPSRRAALEALEIALRLELEILGEFHPLADQAQAAGLHVPGLTRDQAQAGADMLIGQLDRPGLMADDRAVIVARIASIQRKDRNQT